MNIFKKIKRAIFSPFKGLEKGEWDSPTFSVLRSLSAKFCCLLALVLAPSCGICKHLPSEQVNIRDSVVVHHIDSTIIHTATKYKDMAWLGDTLRIEGQRSRSWAYADTTREAVIGGLEEDEVRERIVYKDKLVVKDSIITKEVPVPYEVVREVVPKWSWWCLGWCLLSVIFVVLKIYSKFKK